ncbi:hypothetical protein FQA39_LY13719 [Lamprigera yunnana]|nr:hypothetical protein FQA39_LY13719 [Lamprigera yunnana]
MDENFSPISSKSFYGNKSDVYEIRYIASDNEDSLLLDEDEIPNFQDDFVENRQQDLEHFSSEDELQGLIMMSNAKRTIHSQAREIIYTVYTFMKEEKEATQVTIPLSRLIERVSQATGVGSASVKRIVKEGRIQPDGGNFNSPRKTINKSSTLDQDMEEEDDDEDLDVVIEMLSEEEP